MYYSGILSLFKKFRTHYFVNKLIKPGDIIIDIGANMGYYTRIFSGATGKNGTVWAVEPIPLYRELIVKNINYNSNIIILPYALGNRESIEYMGIPGDKPYRHGLTRIMDSDNKNAGYRVEVKTPEALFSNLEHVDYIKCDIEGYEANVIPGFRRIIERDKPLIQIELAPENKQVITDFLGNMGYDPFIAGGSRLKKIDINDAHDADILYLHKEKQSEYRITH